MASIIFIIFVIVFIPVPIPEHQEGHEYVGYPAGSDAWKFVAEKEVQDSKGSIYPKYYGNDAGYMHVISLTNTLSCIEASFIVPKRGDILSYDSRYNNHKVSSVILYDSDGKSHVLKPSSKYSIGTPYQYDISPFAGQKVTVRIYQSSQATSAHWYYRNIMVTNEPYTIWDNLSLFINTLIYALLLSILAGFLIGASGLEFFNEYINKIEAFIHKHKTEALGFENTYIKSFLRMSFKVLDFSIHAADNIQDKKINNGIKVALILFLSFTIIYTAKFLVYVIVTIVITLLIFAAILGIIALLLGGGAPSFGGGGGGGGGYSGSSSGSSEIRNERGASVGKLDPDHFIFGNRQAIKDNKGNVVGELDSDHFIFGNRQAIKDNKGNVVGELDSDHFIFGNRQAIKDDRGNVIGELDSDHFIFGDGQAIKDNRGNDVKDIGGGFGIGRKGNK
ncbi:hypothetical protein FTO70_04150 [Methanosarcina sp. KYL-1]|uniref:hypothetical protein n=1 Tax=Methanosarcina sp. KYL-1 TaxID=2602068 RepID=UPI002100A34A|nr:hypothetical protein [Methanosarcina sp. KYL-1]MCQ1534894.1 hypothetical protein [Methanosarcina sp. KYL-1]